MLSAFKNINSQFSFKKYIRLLLFWKPQLRHKKVFWKIRIKLWKFIWQTPCCGKMNIDIVFSPQSSDCIGLSPQSSVISFHWVCTMSCTNCEPYLAAILLKKNLNLYRIQNLELWHWFALHCVSISNMLIPSPVLEPPVFLSFLGFTSFKVHFSGN